MMNQQTRSTRSGGFINQQRSPVKTLIKPLMPTLTLTNVTEDRNTIYNKFLSDFTSFTHVYNNKRFV